VKNAPTTDEAFGLFWSHWQNCSPEYHMDDPAIREKVMSLISSTMVILKECPEVFDHFLGLASNSMEVVVPDAVKQKMEAMMEGMTQ
jgi:hypothetical protein